MNLQHAYRAERAPHASNDHVWQQPAKFALSTARTKLAWEAADGAILDEWEAERSDDPPYAGCVRLVLRPDSDCDPTDFDGSERDLKEARERANRDGCCGVEAQFWDGAEWQAVDSVWGFIGSDWRGSGYDVDLMNAALEALAEHRAKLAAELEDSRPDLYANGARNLLTGGRHHA
jgi:hypothetical protein